MLTMHKRKSNLIGFFLTLLLLIAFIFSPFSASAQAAKVSKGDQITKYALNLQGKPFKYGGNTPKGFDASGFTQYVYKNSVKVSLPRTVADQNKKGETIAQKNLQAGDLIFFKTENKKVSFVGIYVGKQKFIAATSKGVKVQSLSTKYWKNAYYTSKRIVK
ncbi:C40 family peptidase [Heyndrickxia sporothermodurans]